MTSVKCITITSLLALSVASFAKEGTNSGGGSNKPTSQFGYENLSAIVNSSDLRKILKFNYGIESVSLSFVDDDGFHYKVIAQTIVKSEPCVVDVTVWNTGAATVDQVQVTSVKVDSGCGVKPTPVVSVIEKYKDVFSRFPSPLDERRPYGEYLNVVRQLSPSQRREIREYMRLSEPKFYEVFTAGSDKLSNFRQQKPKATTNEALILMHALMGFPLDGGIYMPTILGLKFAPFFSMD